jgi:hypothetical protein
MRVFAAALAGLLLLLAGPGLAGPKAPEPEEDAAPEESDRFATFTVDPPPRVSPFPADILDQMRAALLAQREKAAREPKSEK